MTDTSARTALIAGATGLIGSALLERLLGAEAYGTVIAVGRRAPDAESGKLIFIETDFSDLEDKLSGREIDDAFCALGTTIKKAGSQEAFRKVDCEFETAFARAAKSAGVHSFGLVSSVGASSAASNFYLRVKGETEDAIKALGFGQLHVYQPGLLLGDRGENRPGEQIGALLTPVLNCALLGPMRKYRSIEAKTVARAMANAAMNDAAPGTHHFDTIRKLADA